MIYVIHYDFLWFTMIFYDFIWFTMILCDFMWFTRFSMNFPCDVLWFYMIPPMDYRQSIPPMPTKTSVGSYDFSGPSHLQGLWSGLSPNGGTIGGAMTLRCFMIHDSPLFCSLRYVRKLLVSIVLGTDMATGLHWTGGYRLMSQLGCLKWRVPPS